MPAIKRRESESFDVTLRRFKRACEKAGIHSKLRKMEYYEKPTWERRRCAAAQSKRHHKKRLKELEGRMKNRSRSFRYSDRLSNATAPAVSQPIESTVE